MIGRSNWSSLTYAYIYIYIYIYICVCVCVYVRVCVCGNLYINCKHQYSTFHVLEHLSNSQWPADSQRASNEEGAFTSWRHHASISVLDLPWSNAICAVQKLSPCQSVARSEEQIFYSKLHSLHSDFLPLIVRESKRQSTSSLYTITCISIVKIPKGIDIEALL